MISQEKNEMEGADNRGRKTPSEHGGCALRECPANGVRCGRAGKRREAGRDLLPERHGFAYGDAVHIGGIATG